MHGFGLAIIRGIIIGTSSSIFTASPIFTAPRRKTAAAGGDPCSSAEQFRCGAIGG
jgi:preprotein translocase subunit SecF